MQQEAEQIPQKLHVTSVKLPNSAYPGYVNKQQKRFNIYDTKTSRLLELGQYLFLVLKHVKSCVITKNSTCITYNKQHTTSYENVKRADRTYNNIKHCISSTCESSTIRGMLTNSCKDLQTLHERNTFSRFGGYVIYVLVHANKNLKISTEFGSEEGIYPILEIALQHMKPLSEYLQDISEISSAIPTLLNTTNMVNFKNLRISSNSAIGSLHCIPYTISRMVFPRFNYFQKYLTRFIGSMNTTHPDISKDMPELENVHIFIESGLFSDTDKLWKILPEQSNVSHDSLRSLTVETILKEIRHCRLPSFLIIDKNHHKAIRKYSFFMEDMYERILFICECDDDTRFDKMEFYTNSSVFLSTKTNAESMICVMLEKMILKLFRNVYLSLDKLVQSKTTLTKEDDIVLEIQEEILCMLYRTNANNNEYPLDRRTARKRLVDKELAKKLDSIELVQGYCYRLDELHIYVKRTDDVQKEKNAESEIEGIMTAYKIDKYCILPYLETHFSKVCAGSKLISDDGTEQKSATLGSFVLWTKEKEDKLCAIVSQHFALGRSLQLHVINDNGEKQALGTIIKDSVKDHGLDIVAAEIDRRIIDNCETMFTDTDGKLRVGELLKTINLESLTNEHVYIRGAESGLSWGIVRDPACRGKCMDGYLLIEDFRNKSFCKIGDSGSVVCTDNPDKPVVSVIGMIIGSPMPNGETNLHGRKEYIAFLLEHGLKQLALRCGGTFALPPLKHQTGHQK